MKALRFFVLAACVAATTGTALGQTPPSPGLTITVTPPSTHPVANDDTLMSANPNQSMTINALLGFVNDHPVYATDLFRPIDDQLTRLGKSAKTIPQFESDARKLIGNEVTRRVSEELLASAAESALTKDQRSAIDVRINQDRSSLLAKFGESLTAADKALAASEGSSVTKKMDDLKRHYAKDIYIARHIDRNIEITQQMVRDEYERDPKRWQTPEQIDLYTITLPVSRWLREPTRTGEAGPIMKNPTDQQITSAEAQALATADKIVTQLKDSDKSGATFAKLAQDYNSDDEYLDRGGKWKPLARGTLRDTKFEDYIFHLPANKVGAPYPDHEKDFMNSKIIVVMIGDKHPAKVTTFVEAQETLIGELRQKQLEELEQKEMARLSNGAAIEAIERMLDVALNAAVSRYATVK